MTNQSVTGRQRVILNVVLNADTGVQRLWLQEMQRNSAAKECDVARAKAILGNQFGVVSDFGSWALHSGFGFWVQVRLGSATMVEGRIGVMVVSNVCPLCLWE